MNDVDFSRMLRARGVRRRKRSSGLAMILGMLFGGKLMILAVAAAIGGFFFDYSLMMIFAKDIPWYADCVVGLVTCPVAVAVALGCWVAVLCDVETPFVPSTPPAAEAPLDANNV